MFPLAFKSGFLIDFTDFEGYQNQRNTKKKYNILRFLYLVKV